MKFELAIIFFQNQLNSSLQQDSIELEPPGRQYFNIYQSLIPNVFIDQRQTFNVQNILPIHPYWGHYNRYYPERIE
jgi:hypothetical protein